MAAVTFRIDEVTTDCWRLIVTHDGVDHMASAGYATADGVAQAFAATIHTAVGLWDESLWDEDATWRDGLPDDE